MCDMVQETWPCFEFFCNGGGKKGEMCEMVHGTEPHRELLAQSLAVSDAGQTLREDDACDGYAIV